MIRKLIPIALALAITAPASGKLLIETHNGLTITSSDGAIRLNETGGYTLAGIHVADIKRVTNKSLTEPVEPGKMDFPYENAVKPVAVLDMNARNGIKEDSDDGRYLYSAEYMVQVAGLPYFITESLDEALDGASMILFAGCIGKKTFSDKEYDLLTEWVEEGGVLVSPAIEANSSERILNLFGIKDLEPKKKTHTNIRWSSMPMQELEYIDTDEERNTFIGENYIFTTTYVPDGARTLATFDDSDAAAVIKYEKGKGRVYSVGVRWRDVIQRAQLNKSGNNRVKNNHFEVSADVYPLFLRSCYAASFPVAVWKHTIPDGYQSVLIPTHDCDSRTAYDEMFWISDYEKSLGLKAHFFLTTHYFRQQGYLSAFYDEETIPKAKALLANGHTVGSHSICHLPDFSKTDRFPMTETTPEEYAETCTFDIETKTTTGGSTWAEIVMSKNIIERDLGNKVRSFRSGHLCVNANFPEALETGGYSFASCYTATDLWGAFPFFQRFGVKWSGNLTNVLQMPLHYSDVRPTGTTMSEDEIEGTMPVWLDCHIKLKGNYAPNILLIHPNSEWKMKAEKNFIELLDRETVGLYNFEDYGDFWVNRLLLDYDYAYDNGVVKIMIKENDLSAYTGQGLFIETPLAVDKVEVASLDGTLHPVRLVKISDRKYIAVLGSPDTDL